MKSRSKTKSKAVPANVADYLKSVSNDQRIALRKLQRAIKTAAPGGDECISYRIPTFRLNGKMLVSFAAWKEHCAFYPGSHPIKMHQKALQAYDTAKGTIRFPAKKPLPNTLVRKLVATRIKQIID